MRIVPAYAIVALAVGAPVSNGQYPVYRDPASATTAASNRVAWIVALSQMNHTDTNRFATNRPSVVAAAHDPDRGVRSAAATALARSAPPSLDTIRDILADPSPQTRECGAEAARMLARLNRDATMKLLPDLTRTLSDPAWEVRREAACAIQRIFVADMSLRDRVEKVLETDSAPECVEPAGIVSTNAPAP